MALLPKQVCQVRDVEFARFITLTSNSIEPLSFTVPRVKVISSDQQLLITTFYAYHTNRFVNWDFRVDAERLLPR